jgi:hypothetical protein
MERLMADSYGERDSVVLVGRFWDEVRVWNGKNLLEISNCNRDTFLPANDKGFCHSTT